MLLVPIEQEAGDVPEPRRMLRGKEKPMPLSGVKFWFLSHPSCSLVTILSYPSSFCLTIKQCKCIWYRKMKCLGHKMWLLNHADIKQTFTNIWNIKQDSDLFAVYRAYPSLKEQAVWRKDMFKQYIHSADFLVASLHLLIHSHDLLTLAYSC